MRRLTSMLHGGAAAQLCHLLQQAGIESQMTTEDANSYLGSLKHVVWVDEQADQAKVDEIAASLTADAILPSRVDKSDPRTFMCKSCGYDLRGQTADGVCPECRHPYVVLTSWRCPHCNAENTSDFDLCWQCESEEETEPDA